MRQTDVTPPSATVLNSWKEIAIYVGRGVRTVQRWERDLGLPVHRPRGKQRSAVLAIPEELDYWIQNTPGRAHGEFLLLRGNGEPHEPPVVRSTWTRAQNLRAETRDLRARSAALLKELVESTRMQYEGATRLRARIRAMNSDSQEFGEQRMAGAAGSVR